MWYCGDGSNGWSNGNWEGIMLHTVNESGRKDYFRELFGKIGVSPIFYEVKEEESFGKKNPHIKTTITFNKEESKKLLEWMGGETPGFEYKWEIEDREVYDRKMAEAYTNTEESVIDSKGL